MCCVHIIRLARTSIVYGVCQRRYVLPSLARFLFVPAWIDDASVRYIQYIVYRIALIAGRVGTEVPVGCLWSIFNLLLHDSMSEQTKTRPHPYLAYSLNSNPLGGSRSEGAVARLGSVFWWRFLPKTRKRATERPASTNRKTDTLHRTFVACPILYLGRARKIMGFVSGDCCGTLFFPSTCGGGVLGFGTRW